MLFLSVCESPLADHGSCLLQHEDTKRLLTKYSFEKNFRLRDTLAAIPNDLAGAAGDASDQTQISASSDPA